MKQSLSLVVCALTIGAIAGVVTLAADSGGDREEKSFSKLLEQVESQHGGWSYDTRNLRRLFNAERKRLGDRFDREVLRFVGSDTDRHYFCALALELAGSRDGLQPKLELALLLRHQELVLLQRRGGDDIQADKLLPNDVRPDIVATSALAALTSQKLGLTVLASDHKRRAEGLIARLAKLKVRRDQIFPVITRENYRLYESIPTGK